MVHDGEIDRLKRRLQWAGAGPLTDVANHATDALVARLKVATEWMREEGMTHAVISTGDPGHAPARRNYEKAG